MSTAAPTAPGSTHPRDGEEPIDTREQGVPPADRTVKMQSRVDQVPPEEEPSPFGRRLWKVGLIASFFVTTFLVLCYAPEAALLVFAAVWFGCALRGAAVRLGEHTRMGTGWCLAFVVGGLVVSLFVLLAVAGFRMLDQVSSLGENLGSARTELTERLNEQGLSGLAREIPDLPRLAGLAAGGMTGGNGQGGGSPMQAAFFTPLTFGLYVLFIFFTGLFLAISPHVYRTGFVRLFPMPVRDRLTRVMNEGADHLWDWTKARLTAMAITGALTGTVLYFLGIPMAITLGFLTALLVFIPNIGSFLAAIPPVLLAFQLGGLMPLWVLLAYIGVQMLESYLITPYVIREGTGVPPALVISAQLVFGILFGALGVLFATPLVLTAMMFVREYYVEDKLEGNSEVEPAGAST